MPEYSWMSLNKQNFENALGPKYVKLLNMGKFWIWQGSEYGNVTQGSKYATILLNMSG